MDDSSDPLGAILTEIEALGRIPFQRFMELALYGAGGYYTRAGATIGRGGDFVTAPELSPALGATLARLWSRLDPRLHSLVELGPGRGLLLKSFLEQLRRDHEELPAEVAALERGPALARACREALAPLGITPRIVTSPEGLGNEARPALIVANELFDALSFHRVRGGSDASLEEAYVTRAGQTLVEVWGPPSRAALAAYLRDLGVTLAPGAMAEVSLAGPELLTRVAAILARGLVVIIDYGYPAWILYDPERPQGTARGFRDGRLETDLLRDPGRQDLTAHVDFTALARAGRAAGLDVILFADLASFLVGLAAHELPEEARRGLVRLVNAEEIGGTMKVLVLGRGVARGPFRGVRDRSRALEGAASG